VCALNISAWAFVSAPEGTYIYRPSTILINSYLRQPQETIEFINSNYIKDCVDSAFNCVEDAISKIKEIGFIMYFYNNPCINIEKEQPNIVPDWNNLDLETIEQDMTYIRNLNPAKFASYNWSEVISMCITPSVSDNASWLTINLKRNKIIIMGEGHKMDNINNEYSYPMNAFGPILVICFPEKIPPAIPHAAITVSQKQKNNLIWIIFIDISQLVVFRADENGIHSYGPYDHN
jgi:hypothetical protein